MSLLRKIRPLYFFGAFAFGLLACYILAPKPKVIVKFPNPFNAGNIVYTDQAQNCFKFNADKVDCPANAKPQPIAEDFIASQW